MAENERDPGWTRSQSSTEQPVDLRPARKAKRNADRKAEKKRKKQAQARSRSSALGPSPMSAFQRISVGGALLAVGSVIGAALGSTIARTSRS